ncbi:MAG: hypothetical protein LUQ70_04605 [Methanobacteriaceae archaeon]|nr:hypothetical protein [Methanobacteriaceae archaeon]
MIHILSEIQKHPKEGSRTSRGLGWLLLTFEKLKNGKNPKPFSAARTPPKRM